MVHNTIVITRPGGAFLSVPSATESVTLTANLLAGTGRTALVVGGFAESRIVQESNVRSERLELAASQPHRVAGLLARIARIPLSVVPDPTYLRDEPSPFQSRAIGGGPRIAGALQSPPLIRRDTGSCGRPATAGENVDLTTPAPASVARTLNQSTSPWRLSVAPMMDWTDRHCRFFHRLITRRTRLYTEMVTTGALLHGDVARHLDFDAVEHPLALQLGGSEPDDLARCARLARALGL